MVMDKLAVLLHSGKAPASGTNSGLQYGGINAVSGAGEMDHSNSLGEGTLSRENRDVKPNKGHLNLDEHLASTVMDNGWGDLAPMRNSAFTREARAPFARVNAVKGQNSGRVGSSCLRGESR